MLCSEANKSQNRVFIEQILTIKATQIIQNKIQTTIILANDQAQIRFQKLTISHEKIPLAIIINSQLYIKLQKTIKLTVVDQLKLAQTPLVDHTACIQLQIKMSQIKISNLIQIGAL